MLIAASIGLGLLFPGLASMLLPYVFVALFFVIVFSLNTLDESALDVLGTIDVFTWTVVCWQMFIVPAIVTLFCVLFSAPPTIALILLATTTAGSVFASPALVEMAGLNRTLAVRGMIISTFMMPISLLLFGTMNDALPADMSFVHYGRQIVIFLVIPLAISSVFSRIKRKFSRAVDIRVSHGMNWASTLALMVFCAGIMAKIHGSDVTEPGDLILYLELAVGVAILMYFATGILFARFGRRDSLTAGMLVANRNVALSFGLLSTVFPEEVMVYVAVSQFPIFLTPIVIRMGQMVQSAYREHAAAERIQSSD